MANCKHLSNWKEGELLPHAVDRLAREQPNAPYGLWPIAQTSYDAGFRTITYAQLGNMVNGLAWWIKQHMGTSSEVSGQLEVLAYIGPNDVRLTALVLASIKTGYGLFLTSPRNSPAAHQALFTALQCRTLITAEPTPPPVQSLLDAVKPRPAQLTVPSIDELLAEQHSVFAYDKSFEEGRLDPLFIIHSSGSTGMPKPKIWTQESAARHQACSMADHSVQPGAVSVEELLWGKRILVTLPPFHGAGLAMYLFWAITFRAVPIAPAALGIVTAQGLAEALEQTPAEVAFLVPSVVVELAQNPDLLARCAKHLKAILYAGGDLPQALGDRVAASIPLRCWWGATECGLPQQITPPGLGPQDWRYIRFHPCLGAVFDKVAEDTYELVIRRNDGLQKQQVSFSIRGQENWAEYRTSDLFQPHPTVPDAWCWRGRADDIVVFLNGEKTNPVSMEQHVVANNAEITSAVVIGTRRFQAALLIELPASSGPLTTTQEAELIERLWPSVQEANKIAPAHARVDKALILVLPADRPLIRAGKGTIQRAASIEQYAAEIDRLYDNADVIDDESGESQVAMTGVTDLSDEESIRRFIGESVEKVTGWISQPETAHDRDGNKSFFEHGMDSLMALQLLRTLRRGLRRPDLGLSTIYSNPTVSQLQAALRSNLESGENKDDDALLMKSLLSRYTELIQQIPRPAGLPAGAGHEAPNSPTTVILTGSTGTIGTHILQALLNHANTKHIICLNRGEDGGRNAQESRFASAGVKIDAALLDRRVTFLHADLSQPRLGLEQATYDDLRTRVGLIIHNAWPVNFNLGLRAFQPQLAGVINLIRLAAESSTKSRAARLVFLSSVGAVGQLAATGAAPVPERVFTSFDTPYTSGYARSKFLSELLCNAAAETLGLSATVVRIGQVAGAIRPGESGEWNRREWLPSLVIGSRDIGCLPEDIGPFSDIDWIPVDVLADVLVDLATCQPQADDADSDKTPGHKQTGARVFNLRNPRTTTWQALLPAIVAQISHKTPQQVGPEVGALVEVVGSATWLARLSARESEIAPHSQGALKLFGFYRGVLWGADEEGKARQKAQPMDITRALVSSAALRGVQAVNPGWVSKWVSEWMVSES